MNIDCEKLVNNLDDSEDDFRIYFQKIVILRFVQQLFCEMLIGGRIIFTLTHFLKPQISEKCAK